MARVLEKLVSRVLPRELEDIALENTLQYDPCEDETQNEQSCPQLNSRLKVAHEYIRAKILLPIGNQMARGHVVTWTHDEWKCFG